MSPAANPTCPHERLEIAAECVRKVVLRRIPRGKRRYWMTLIRETLDLAHAASELTDSPEPQTLS